MRSLALKLTLAFLAVSLAGILLVGLLAGLATADEFGHFVLNQSMVDQGELAQALADYYHQTGGWQGVELLLPDEIAGMMGGSGMGMGPGMMRGMMGGLSLADAGGRVVVAGPGHRLGTQLSQAQLSGGLAIEVDGRRVGTLLLGRGAMQFFSPAGEEFLRRVNRALLLGGLGAGLLALALGGLLARALVRPLREITGATREVARGNLDQRLAIRSRDEVGELAAAFNQMSADLARARDQRRQMTADIAHDLRTPLSVILGHAEALRDGVLLPTPETLGLVHDEAQRLNRLVEDLRTLSLAESGELTLARRPASPGELLERAAATLRPRAGRQSITLETQVAPGLPLLEVDPDRLAQVLGNLLDNALRHTPAGGRVTLQARPAGALVLLSVQDTGPGIAPQDLPRIFERFYRADRSRTRTAEPGGSGLGLAIARSIVEAHGGRIRAENAPGGGAQFVIELPVAHASPE